jgi:tetratricopeptide (TPR) repeat protein
MFRLETLLITVFLISASAVFADDDMLNRARALVQEHRYEESRKLYRELVAETSDQEEKARLERELNFLLPYYQAAHLYERKELEKAQQVIVNAIRANRAHPERVERLKSIGVRILAARQDPRGADRPPDEKTVARRIGEIFKAYYRRHRRYPPDYEALNRLLPPEQGLLRWYDVIGYRASKRFYSIQLRNRTEHSQVLDLSGGSVLP